MKYALSILLLAAPCWGDEVASRQLYDAMRMVESGGDDNAVGDGGTSRGPYQISAAYWSDACKAGGVQWDYLQLVWSRPHCEYIMHCFWNHYGAKTDEERARIHNGGPNGMQKESAIAYWNRVKALLDK